MYFEAKLLIFRIFAGQIPDNIRYRMKCRLAELLKRLFPTSLWTWDFTVTWIMAAATVLLFDLLWSYETTFRGMSYAATWCMLLFAATFLSFPMAFNFRKCQLLLFAVVDLLMVANLMYCRTYLTTIPLGSYLLAGNLTEFTESVTDSMRWRDLLLFIPLVWTWWLTRRPNPHRRGAALTYLLTLVAAAVPVVAVSLPYGGPVEHIRSLKKSCYKSKIPPVLYTLAGPLVEQALDEGDVITPRQRKRVDDWFAQSRAYQHFGMPADTLRRDNIIMVICESLESWVLEKSVEGQELTPFLNSVIRDSTTLYAPMTVSQVGNGRSIDGALLLLTGMYPMTNDVYSNNFYTNTYFTLPKALKEAAGARYYVLTPDKPAVWNLRNVTGAFGADTLLSRDNWVNDEMIGAPAKLSDGSFMRQTVDKMRRGEIWPVGENAFVQIVTYSGHNPFVIPDELRTVHFKEEFPRRMDGYMALARYTDSALKTLVNYVRSRPDASRTMIIIVGDHEGLANYRKEMRSKPQWASIVAKEPYVPMVVINSPRGGRVDFPIGQADVYTTALDLAGLGNYVWPGMGVSALSVDHPHVAVGSFGEMYGDVDNAAPERIDHLKRARETADVVIRFNMLDSITGSSITDK